MLKHFFRMYSMAASLSLSPSFDACVCYFGTQSQLLLLKSFQLYIFRSHSVAARMLCEYLCMSVRLYVRVHAKQQTDILTDNFFVRLI